MVTEEKKLRENRNTGEDQIRQMEKELDLERQRLDIIFSHTTVNIWDYDYQTHRILQSTHSRKIHGFGPVVEDVPDSLIEGRFVHPDSADEFRAMYNELLAGAQEAEGTFLVQTADRIGYRYEHIRYRAIVDEDGIARSAVGMSTDVSDELETRQSVRRWKELLSSTLEKHGAVIEFDLSGDRFIGIDNSVFGHDRSWSEYTFDAYIDAYIQQYVHPNDWEQVKENLRREKLLKDYERGTREFAFEFRIKYEEKVYWIRLNVRLLLMEGKGNVRLYLIHTDITDQKKKELDLQWRADRDSITELLNHRAFREQVQKYFTQLPEKPHTMMILDLDRFKEINDNYGHMTGDRMLQYVGKSIDSLLEECPEQGIPGRVGGDEFAVFFPHCDRGCAEKFAEQLVKLLSEPAVDGICFSASIGVAVSPTDGEDYEELYLAADRALYYVKRHGRNGYCFYDHIWHEEKETLMRRQQMLSDTIPGGMMGGYMEEGFPFYFIDDNMLNWLGYKDEEEFVADIDGMIDNCMHPDDRGYVNKAVEQQLMHGSQYVVDYRMRKQDGSYIWVHDIGEKMVTSNGRLAITSVCHDITAEKEHASVIQRMVNDANGGIALYRIEDDWTLPLLYSSENLGQLAGYSDEEYQLLCQTDALGVVYEKDRDTVLKTIRKAISEDVATSVSYRVMNKQGGYTWLTGTFSKHGEDQGKTVLRTIYMPVPIQYELQLQTLNMDNFSVYVVDRYTKELYYANDASFVLHDVPFCDITGKTCYQVYFDRNTTCQDCILDRAKECNGEHFLYPSRGRTIDIQVQERQWNNKEIMVIYGRDVTEEFLVQKKRDELLNRIPGGLCLYRYRDGEFEVLMFNAAISKVLGIHFAEGFTPYGIFEQYVHPEDQPKLKRYIDQCVKKTGTHYSYQYRMWNETHQVYRWIETRSNVIRHEDGLLFYSTYSDVTETRQLQEELRESRETIETACDFADIWVFTYDTKTRTAYIGEKMQRDYGISGEETNFPERLFRYQIILPEYEELICEKFRQLCDGVPEVVFELQAYGTDREIHWHRVKGQLMNQLNGSRNLAVISVQIIDTEKAMEARLKLEHKKAQANDQDLLYYYIANISQGTVMEYRDQTMEMPAFQRKLPLDSFVEEGNQHLLYDEEREHIIGLHQRERLLSNYQKGIEQEAYETYVQLSDGRIIWTRHNMQLLQSPMTKDILLYEYVYNSDHNQIVQAMMQMEINYGYEVMGNVFIREDQFAFLEDRHQSGTPELFHTSFTQYIHSYAKIHLHEDDRKHYIDHYENLSRIAEDPQNAHAEVLYRTIASDGSIRYHKDDNYFYDKKRGIVLVTRREYTDFIQAEEAERRRLDDALGRAEEIGKKKNEFLARMSHDMRTPMNAIIGLMDLIDDDAGDPDTVRSHLGQMRSASNFLLGLVDDILDIAKLEDQSFTLNLEPYPYQEFLTNMKAILLSQCEEKRIRLEFQPLEENPVIRCDKTRLNQIFYNLFSNAIKYTPEGGCVGFLLKNVTLSDGWMTADYVVQDTGVGMSEDFQKHMFEPFTRERNEFTAGLQGNGLGLGITKQLVELMDGKIRIESQKGKGTTVTVNLSFQRLDTGEKDPSAEAESSETKSENPEAKSEISLKGKVVLLAEDHPLNAEIAAKLLEKQGMIVLRAENGRRAVELFQESDAGAIDVILMDIRMPEMDGLEATAVIRALEHPDAQRIPIIAMSANAYPEDVKKSLDAGMDQHLSKPIDRNLLVQTLERCLLG